MSDTFYTIESASEGIFKEKGSKFIAFAIPVQTTEKAKEIVQQKRKEFYDARHVCYAYMIGHERCNFRTNDDGEPSSTAGKPILGQINSNNLTDILIIVVRYFGGVLLGTSGLISAYKSAAANAITNAKIIERIVKIPIQLSFEYEQMNAIMRIAKEFELEISSQKFGFKENTMMLYVRKALLEQIRSELEKYARIIAS